MSKIRIRGTVTGYCYGVLLRGTAAGGIPIRRQGGLDSYEEMRFRWLSEKGQRRAKKRSNQLRILR